MKTINTKIMIAFITAFIIGCQSAPRAKSSHQQNILGIGQRVDADLIKAEKAVRQLSENAQKSASDYNALFEAVKKGKKPTDALQKDFADVRSKNPSIYEESIEQQAYISTLDAKIQQKAKEWSQLQGSENEQVRAVKQLYQRVLAENIKLQEKIAQAHEDALSVLHQDDKTLTADQLRAKSIALAHQAVSHLDKLVENEVKVVPKENHTTSASLLKKIPFDANVVFESMVTFWQAHGGKSIIAMFVLLLLFAKRHRSKRLAQSCSNQQLFLRVIRVMNHLEPYQQHTDKKLRAKTERFFRATEKLKKQIRKSYKKHGAVHPRLVKSGYQSVYLSGEAVRRLLVRHAHKLHVQFMKRKINDRALVCNILDDNQKVCAQLAMINREFHRGLSS